MPERAVGGFDLDQGRGSEASSTADQRMAGSAWPLSAHLRTVCSALRRRIRSRLPTIAGGRLKSWAKPPVTRPITSIFVDCRNAVSALTRYVVSTASGTMSITLLKLGIHAEPFMSGIDKSTRSPVGAKFNVTCAPACAGSALLSKRVPKPSRFGSTTSGPLFSTHWI